MFTPSQQPARLIPQPEALALLPASVAAAHTLLPLRANHEQLVCAGPGPFDLNFLSRLQFQLQRHLTLVRVPEELFNEAFERQYGSRLVPQAPALLDSLCKEPPKLKAQNPNNPMDWAQQPCQTTVIVGAAGGVGTTSVAANLAVLLAERNLNVAFLDANFSRPGAHIALGSRPAFTIRDLKRGKTNAWDALAAGTSGVRIIAGEPGASDCAEIANADLAEMGVSPDHLAGHFDHYLIDLPGNPSESQLSFALRANRILIVANDEPAVLHNTLALAKTILSRDPSAHISVVFNQCNRASDAKKAFLKLRGFLGEDAMHYAGNLPVSKNMENAWNCRTPLAKLKPSDPAIKALSVIQGQLLPLRLGVSAISQTEPLAQTS